MLTRFFNSDSNFIIFQRVPVYIVIILNLFAILMVFHYRVHLISIRIYSIIITYIQFSYSLINVFVYYTNMSVLGYRNTYFTRVFLSVIVLWEGQ